MAAKVLVVENDSVIAKEIESTLYDLGYQVVGLNKSGIKTFDLLKSQQPDIVLLDIHLKGNQSAIELAKIIRRKYNLPFIFLAGYSNDELLTLAGSVMPYGYLIKPLTVIDLKTNIEIALARFQAEKKQHTLCWDLLQEQIEVPLSKRDKQVLTALVNGLSYKDIAAKHFISINTVKTYQKRIFNYFDVKSRFELVRMCQDIMSGRLVF